MTELSAIPLAGIVPVVEAPDIISISERPKDLIDMYVGHAQESTWDKRDI